jgi:hypothetical protein
MPNKKAYIGAREGDTAAFFAEPWEICNNCKQPFQCQLSIDLSSAFVSFAESTYSHPGNSKWDKLKVMESLRSKIRVMFTLCIIKVGKFDPNMKVEVFSPKIDRTEVSFIIDELILIVDQTKKDLKMNIGYTCLTLVLSISIINLCVDIMRRLDTKVLGPIKRILLWH